jgi:hypothetical protein
MLADKLSTRWDLGAQLLPTLPCCTLAQKTHEVCVQEGCSLGIWSRLRFEWFRMVQLLLLLGHFEAEVCLKVLCRIATFAKRVGPQSQLVES